jgi:hypothetical protein
LTWGERFVLHTADKSVWWCQFECTDTHPRQADIRKFVVLYTCESLSATAEKENRSERFGNRVLRRIFGPMREELAGEWRQLQNEDLLLE